MKRRGDYVILDNGAAEDLVYGAKHLHTLAEQLEPDEIVIQDVMGSGNDTLAMAQGFARYAQPDYRYMFVLQGTSMQEVLHSLRVVSNSTWAMYVTSIGIPRHLSTIDKYFRVNFLEFLLTEQFDKQFDFHFLGAHSWMKEIVLLAELAEGRVGIRGLDTSLPIYMGLLGLDLTKNRYVTRPQDFFDTTYTREMI